jgi:DNA-binding transcriptional regulator YiaG
MALAFRNINASPDDPVTEWHLEGIQTALERGDLSHWRRIAAEVCRDPWGQVAQELSDVLTYSHPYGVGELMTDILRTARSERERQEREEVAEVIRGLVEASALTGQEFAARIGTSASRLSTYMSGKVVPSAALLLRMRQVVSGRSSADKDVVLGFG